MDVFVKDLGIVHDTAHRDKSSLPFSAQALSQFILASAQDLDREDGIAAVKFHPGIALPGSAASDAGFDAGPVTGLNVATDADPNDNGGA